MEENPLDDPINECWACRVLFADGDGFSLSGEGEPVVCRDCWERMSVFERLILGQYCRPIAQGGAGLPDLIRAGLYAYPFNQLPKFGRQ